MVVPARRFFILQLFLVHLLVKSLCFNVKFRHFHNAEMAQYNTQIYKREMSQFFDKSSYSFNGFEKVESIPVIFPTDICILYLQGTKYATSLYKNQKGIKYFAVFKMNNGSYSTIADIPTPKAIAMDCIGVGSKGYIALAFNLTQPIENARQGSPIYQLENERLSAVQYFSAPNLNNVYLRVQGNNILLLQSFENAASTPNLVCPYFSWSGSTFNRVGGIPCSNARHLEPFSIDHENYVAVANYADPDGRTSTHSEIYKFAAEKKRFQLFQRIKTNGAVDVRFFRVPIDEFRKQNFLIFGNSLNSVDSKNREADSVFYVYEKGQFIPYQRLKLYAVEQFLPIQNIDAEKFLLLVSCENQDIKIYNLNDWKFEESTAQFTAGALGRGVSRMRSFQQNEESYLVIANELMTANETNIFLPIFKQEEHANALRQQIIDWTTTNLERLERINIEQLKRAVEQKLSTRPKSSTESPRKTQQIPKANIDTVITQSLISPQRRLNSNYWKALEFSNRALNALEAQYTTRRTRKRELPARLYDFDQLDINTLHVKGRLAAKEVNGVANRSPAFDEIRAKKLIVTGRYTAPVERSAELENLAATDDPESTLNVQQLTLNGKLNGFELQRLFNNTLKRKGAQVLKETATFSNLKAKNVTLKSNQINGMSLDKMVSIDSGSFVVAQDVLFNATLFAKALTINDRLNQIPINQRKLDVLLKKSNETQTVTGIKRLNNLRLLQPIMMTGSISSNHLRSISPSRAVYSNLVLQGDYVIDGDVLISKLLNTDDLIALGMNVSVKNTLNNGLNIDAPLEDVNIRFGAAVKTNNSDVSFANARDLQQLIKTNTKDLQIVSGLKIFKNGLTTENGLSEVGILNGVNTEDLENRLFLKDTNQTIRVPFNVERVLARAVRTPNLSLNNRTLETFLTKSGNQTINADLRVKTLEVGTLEAENLNTNGRIFNRSLTEIYQHKSKVQPKTDIFHRERKFPGTVYVKNLVINGSLNEKPVSELETLLTQLGGNIKYVGNFKFNSKMDVANLTFDGELNGIKAADFGNCWLRKSGDQTFTAMQTFSSVEFGKGATLAGKLNGHTISDFIENTYWTDRDEFIREAIFQNPVELEKPLYTETLNGLRVPMDMLYRKSSYEQIINVPITIEGDLKVQGSITNTAIVNNISLEDLQGYLINPNPNATLFLEHANFSYAPNYRTLNKYDLSKTLDSVWLVNEDIELANNVEISAAYFQGLIRFEGPVNNIDLKYLKDNYLSKSKPQVITSEAIFKQNVKFESDVRTSQTHLLGPLIETESGSPINFNEFISNTLKRSGLNIVTGNWTLLEAAIRGDVKNVVINNLNLVNDVVRMNGNNIVTGRKSIPSAEIDKIYSKDGSTINDVDIVHWLRNAAYVDRNQTIYGTTTMDNAHLDEMHVAGNVNNIAFDESHLLLTDKPQTIYGTYTFRNKFPAAQRILTNNIKKLYAERINGYEVDVFLRNLTKLTAVETLQERYLNTHLIFEQPLFISEYDNDNVDYVVHRKREVMMNEDFEEMSVANLEMLEKSTRIFSSSVRDHEAVLYDFMNFQVLKRNATKLIPLTVRSGNDIVSLIGLINESSQNNTVEFYYWNKEKKLFVPNDTNLFWLPQDSKVLEAISMVFGADYLTLERPRNEEVYKQSIVSGEDFKELQDFTQNDELIEPLKHKGNDCFAVYGKHRFREVEIHCLHLNTEESLLNLNKAYEIEKNAQQVLALSDSHIAILAEDSIEIWNTSNEFARHQQLKMISKPKEMAAGQADGISYLAVVTTNSCSTLLCPTIEVYSSNLGVYKHQETIELQGEPQQVAFGYLRSTKDLLLFLRISTDKLNSQIMIYQLKGVMGFQLVAGPKTLLESDPHHMQVVDLKAANEQFLALFGSRGTVSFVDFKSKIF